MWQELIVVALGRSEMRWPDWVSGGHEGVVESHRGVNTSDEIGNVAKVLEDLCLAYGRDGGVRGLNLTGAASPKPAQARGRGLRNRVDRGSEHLYTKS